MSLDTLLKDAPTREQPKKVDPMLAATCTKSFDREGWIFEVKWDGYRTVAIVRDQIAKLYSRRNITFTKYKPIEQALSKLPHNAVLDGEMVVLDEQGRAYIDLLREYNRSEKGNLAYYVFDILHLKDRDLRSLALETRKQILEDVVGELNAPNVLLSKYVEGKGIEFHREVKKRKIEGVMAKNARSSYKEGQRSNDWQKIKYTPV